MAGSFAECVLFFFTFDSHNTAGSGMPISQVGKLSLNNIRRGLSSAGEAGIPPRHQSRPCSSHRALLPPTEHSCYCIRGPDQGCCQHPTTDVGGPKALSP